MSLITQVTSIRTEDFDSEQRKWIGKLLAPINQFLLSATTAINGNITFGDNIPCQTVTMSFTYGGETDFPKVFKWNLPNKPVEVRVCAATEDGAGVAIVIAWSYTSNSLVSISQFWKLSASGVSTLSVGSLYNITLRSQP